MELEITKTTEDIELEQMLAEEAQQMEEQTAQPSMADVVAQLTALAAANDLLTKQVAAAQTEIAAAQAEKAKAEKDTATAQAIATAAVAAAGKGGVKQNSEFAKQNASQMIGALKGVTTYAVYHAVYPDGSDVVFFTSEKRGFENKSNGAQEDARPVSGGTTWAHMPATYEGKPITVAMRATTEMSIFRGK